MRVPLNIYPNGQPSLPSTSQIIYQTEFKRRFRDKSILPRITNRSYEGKFRGKGTVMKVPILPIIETHKTKAGEMVKYQSPKGSDEEFMINRERYFALKFEDEERIFSAMNFESEIVTEANRQMAEDVEQEFLGDIIYKTHAANTGNEAGIRSGSYKLGDSTDAVYLYKTTEAQNAATGVTNKNVATDYIVGAINVLNEMPGGLDTKPFIIIPTAIGNLLQTSELKMANWMGDAQSVMRKNVQFLGELNGATVIVDNQLPMWKPDNDDAIFSIFFGDSSAISFVDEARVEDKNMKDTNEWGTFHRSKMIYDWFVRYPERIGAGFVSIG